MLLRNGARIVTSAKDVLEDLAETLAPYNLAAKNETKKAAQDEASLLILETIKNSAEPLHVDKLVEITKLDPNVVTQKLTFLTLDGFIEESNGKFRIHQ